MTVLILNGPSPIYPLNRNGSVFIIFPPELNELNYSNKLEKHQKKAHRNLDPLKALHDSDSLPYVKEITGVGIVSFCCGSVVDPMKDEVVLREGGFNLRRSDLEFLKGPCFVTDRLIDSYFSVFLSEIVSDEVLFIPSSITYWLANAGNLDEIAKCLDDLDLTRGEMVLFPINNDRDFHRIEARPGTHWSLLVYDSFEHEFIHFDSVREDGDDSNDEFAMRIYDNIEYLVPLVLEEGQEEPEEEKTFEFRTVRMADPAKGFNKYDCGLHVIAMAAIICEWYLKGRHSEKDRGYEALIQEMDASEERETREMIKDAIMLVTGKDIMKFLVK